MIADYLVGGENEIVDCCEELAFSTVVYTCLDGVLYDNGVQQKAKPPKKLKKPKKVKP